MSDNIVVKTFKDVDGECNAHCYIKNECDIGQNTFSCSLNKNHEGRHQQEFRDGNCLLTWKNDERCYHLDGFESDGCNETYCRTCHKTLYEIEFG